MAGERFPYQSSGERGRQGRQREEGKRGNVKEREWGRRSGEEGGGGDETDIHSKRVLALVILSLFCAAQFSLCVSVLSVSI